MGRAVGSIAVMLVMLAGFGSPARALDTPNERITLVGLTGVHLVVYEFGDEAERAGLTRAGVQAEVEERLRAAGLRVLRPSEALAAAGRPTLELRVSLTRSGEAPDLYVYSVDLGLRQQIRLGRDRAIESFAVTWSDLREVGTVAGGRLPALREVVRGKVEQFVGAWRTANAERY